MNDTRSAIIVGVGGQGAILISKIMTAGLNRAGFDVKQSEVHGMAQRGGSVSTQIRWGTKVYGPVFGRGEADLMIAFEQMEAVRYASFLKPDGIAVVSRYRQNSLSTASGPEPYPEGCLEAMERSFQTLSVDAEKIARELGNSRCMNVVLFGAACDALNVQIDWEAVVSESVPEKTRDLNLVAFQQGRAAVKK